LSRKAFALIWIMRAVSFIFAIILVVQITNAQICSGTVSAVSSTILLADALPGATPKPVTVSFTIQTPLASTQLVTITWPAIGVSGSYLSGSMGVTFAGPANTFSTTTSAVTNGVTIAVGTAGAPAGSYTITLTGATIGVADTPFAATTCGLTVRTPSDLPGTGPTVAIGGQVSAVNSVIQPADRVPGATTKPVTVTFRLQTALANTQLVTISWPPVGASGSFLSANMGVTFADRADTFSTTTSAITNGVTIAVGTAGAPAGPYTITLTGATIGVADTPFAATNDGFTVRTPRDLPGTGPTVAIGGQVSAVNSVIQPADRVPGATTKPVTVSFTIQTPLASTQLVTITWPAIGASGSYLSGSMGVTFAGPANTFSTTTSAIANGVTIAVGTAGAAAGSYTITLTGATIGVAGTPFAAGTGTACGGFNFFVSTANDLPGGANLPAIGGRVTAVSFSVAATDRVPGGAGKPVTVSFTTQTVLVSGASVVITIPNSYISGPIGVTYAGAANTFAATTNVAPTSVTITVGTAGAAAGSYTVTLTGATMGTPIDASTTGVSVRTDNDFPGVTGYPALGGAVTGTTLEIATADRVAIANRRLVVRFTTTTPLVNNNVINIILDTGSSENPIIAAVTPGAVTGIAATAALSATNNIVLTVGAAGVAAGARVVTICGVTLNPVLNNNMFGVRVTTTNDFTNFCSELGTVGVSSRVTDVSMTMPFANRVASNSGQAVTFSFTTATAIPAVSASSCNAQNTVVITFPTNFFVDNVAGSACDAVPATISATGLTGYSLPATAIGPSTPSTFSLVGTAGLPAGTYSVTISGLTLGTQMAGSDTGITVRTNLDAVNSPGSPSGPISGYQVTSVSMPSCQSGTCQNFVIGFSTAGAAGTIAPGSTLVFTFSGNIPLAGAPNAFMSGPALITGAIDSSANTLTLTVAPNSGAWVMGATVTLTLSGMTVANTGLLPRGASAPFTVQVTGSSVTSTLAYSMAFSPTGLGTTTTTSLTITRPVPGQTNTQATIVFSTTRGIASGDSVRIFYPTGFFIATPTVGTCLRSPSYQQGASGLGDCSTLEVMPTLTVPLALTPAGRASTRTTAFIDVRYTGTGRAAGTQTVILSGVTLSTTVVPASNTFSVVTTENSCSAGMISTGSIDNANPGGPSTPSAAASMFLSAALACALLFLL